MPSRDWTARAPAPAIRAHGLVKSFGTLRAVDDITFDLAPGRIYGFGPTGSGKSTLIRLLTGLTVSTAGWAEVLGTARMPSRANLGRIGYMTPDRWRSTAPTVAENPLSGAAHGVDGLSWVEHALGIVDLADRRASIVGTLSGGQRRRLFAGAP